MYKKYLAAVAAMGLASAAAAAQPGYFDGYVAIHVADNKFDLGETEKFSTFGGRASMSYVSTNKIGGQLDIYHSQGNSRLGDSMNVELKYQDAAGHLFYRTQEYLIGGILQKSSSGFESIDVSSNLYGLEGQYYLNRTTLGVKVGNQKLDSFGGQSASGRFFDVEIRHFVEDNWRIGAGYANNNLSGSDVRSTLWSLSTEYRLKNSPISLFAKYFNNRTKVDFGSDSTTLKNNTIMVGATLNFGGSNSLFERDRKGATLNPVNVDRMVNSIGLIGPL